jgi:proteasome alpha subunit
VFGSDPSYDSMLTIFSPDGRLFQVEYAYEAVRKGTSILGLRCANGVVLGAVLRKLPLQDPTQNDKIFEIDDSIGAAIAGLSADGRVLVAYARLLAQIHRLTFGEAMPVRLLSKKLSDHMQSYTMQGGTRPFGVSLLLVGVDSAPQLYVTTPIGSFWSYKAHAVGMGEEDLNQQLTRDYAPTMNVDQGLLFATRILKQVQGTKATPEGIALAKVTDTDKRFTRLDAKAIQGLIDQT